MKTHKAKFPESEGWVRARLTMKTATPLSELEIKKIVSWGSVESYEFGLVEQYGKTVKVIYRKREERSA